MKDLPDWFDSEDFQEPLPVIIFKTSKTYEYNFLIIKVPINVLGNCGRFEYGNCVFYLN